MKTLYNWLMCPQQIDYQFKMPIILLLLTGFDCYYYNLLSFIKWQEA